MPTSDLFQLVLTPGRTGNGDLSEKPPELFLSCDLYFRMKLWTARYLDSRRRGAASVELIALATIVMVGLMVGITTIRDAAIAELSDVVGSVQDLNQSYLFNGLSGHSVLADGSQFGDATDHCDNPNDVAGWADNCIVFGVLPTNEIYPPPNGNLAVLLDFDLGAGDASGSGNDANLLGDAMVVDGMLILDGDGDAVTIDNTSDINLGIHDMRTISLDFKADDVMTRQVLYEEGGGLRGLVIYIEDGMLYVGGWNIPNSESGWDPVFISTPVTAGQWFNVALTLNGTTTVQPGALSGYVNGNLFGTAAGSQLWNHGGGIGIGAINGATILQDGVQNGGANFAGMIDDFYLYNTALDATDIANIANQ